ncbi:hypothetical protein AVEN_180150-1 [Araneus ventricosus]|uniref:Uncharacterized protein n=1 Tax=Araneus ventricosus TaxID=182803 RepID=A0A4Y2D4A7_ARAVE|nr:hypothetical protein AVEN_180150-1 [Araneus ventricosus]
MVVLVQNAEDIDVAHSGPPTDTLIHWFGSPLAPQTVDAFGVLKVIQTTTQQSAQWQNPFISRSPVLKIFRRVEKILSMTKDPCHYS